ncbi:MAG: hypothetical protein ACPG31_02340 [Planctomycetota bacterium]
MAQSWHGLGVAVMLRLSNDLSLTQPAIVNTATSSYHIEAGSHTGTMLSGSIMPEPGLGMSLSGTCPSLSFDIVDATPSRSVALLYANSAGNFIIPTGVCGSIYVQALDVTSCETSTVLLLP